MSADIERNLLNHYQLTNLYPSEYPTRDGESDVSGDEQPVRRHTSQKSKKNSRRLSRFSSLDSRTNYKSRLSGSEETGMGSGNIVQKDEPDPLGIAPSVVSELRARGLGVEDNLKLRNRFMLSSTTFSPPLFLSQVHQSATTNDLLQGLDFLSRSIEKKSASLKVLVESNFERFVKAKATIDSVYTEMRTQGVPAPQKTGHSRVSSRTQGHFRNSSNPFSPQGQTFGEEKKKTALTKETEYGVQGIKAPLLELAVKADEVWGPALGGRNRGEDLKSTLTFIERHHDIFQLGGRVQASIRRHDHEALIKDYQTARQAANEARSLLNRADGDPSTLAEEHIFQILSTGKMWYDVDSQVARFRKSALKQLTDIDIISDGISQDERRESHTELISVLLQLGTTDNPIWLWLSSWQSRLHDKITRFVERARLDLEIFRRRLAAKGPPTDQQIKTYFQSATATDSNAQLYRLDNAQVIQFWMLLETTFESLLSLKTGLLGDIVDYWENAKSYIDGRAQKDLPSSVWSIEGSKQHLQMSSEHMRQLKTYTFELVRLIKEATYTLFLEPPIDDISGIISSSPPSPNDQTPPMTPTDKLRHMGVDPSDLPPPTPKIGEAWERYAFWAPHANALSASRFLSKVLIRIGSSFSDATTTAVVKEDPRGLESLRSLIGSVRERCAQAVCGAFSNDAEYCKLLEDWTRNTDRRDLTNMPARFVAFEEAVLADLQKILFLSEAMVSPTSGDVVVPPPAKLLQMVRSQFVTTLYKALSGAVENAEASRGSEREKDANADELITPVLSTSKTQELSGSTVLPGRNIRMLLTLSNLQHLQRDVIPHLITQFETSFSVKLTEESNTIRDVLGQIETRLFQSYVKPTQDRLAGIINAGVLDPAWPPRSSKPVDARPYVYDLLLELVLIHTEVSTSASTLTKLILTHHLQQVSTALLDAFKQRPKYNLLTLMQATLDVELTAQTLNTYNSPSASDTQSRIYVILDDKTDDSARTQLQNELPEMRASLKKLREGTKGQFGCFKRDRTERGREGKPGSSGRQ